MSLGLPQDKTTIDARAGQVAISVREAMRQVQIFQTWLAATPQGNLTALGYTTGEVATLGSAMTDLAKLASIYGGTAVQATTYDFTTFAKLLTGTA